VDLGSNVNSGSDWQSMKQPNRRSSTEAGMHIGFDNEQCADVLVSIRDNFAPDSNANVDSDVHSAKHSSCKIATEAGMQIDCKDAQRKKRIHANMFQFRPAFKFRQREQCTPTERLLINKFNRARNTN
jgi:hypothetical protein